MISTDSILMGEGRPSRLFYGCYPRFLARYVREKKLCSLEMGIRKITGLAAEQFSLRDRGRVEKNAFADLVVFDYDAIGTRATFAEPTQFPDGIEHVFINGRHTINRSVFNADPLPGKMLRMNA
jgi:N-acyl-D-amino-acid deacylase